MYFRICVTHVRNTRTWPPGLQVQQNTGQVCPCMQRSFGETPYSSTSDDQDGGHSSDLRSSKLVIWMGYSNLIKLPDRLDLISQIIFNHPSSLRMTLTALQLKPRSWETETFQNWNFLCFFRAYHWTWKACFAWCKKISFHAKKYSMEGILVFLHQALIQILPWLPEKGRFWALASLFKRPLASFLLITTFVQDVSHIPPIVQPPVTLWDLNLILFTLQMLPFWNRLTHNVVFLISHNPCEAYWWFCKKNPYLILQHVQRDNGINKLFWIWIHLSSSGGFSFSSQLDIISSLCLAPIHQKGISLLCLDVVNAVQVYLSATDFIRKIDSLFLHSWLSLWRGTSVFSPFLVASDRSLYNLKVLRRRFHLLPWCTLGVLLELFGIRLLFTRFASLPPVFQIFAVGLLFVTVAHHLLLDIQIVSKWLNPLFPNGWEKNGIFIGVHLEI